MFSQDVLTERTLETFGCLVLRVLIFGDTWIHENMLPETVWNQPKSISEVMRGEQV